MVEPGNPELLSRSDGAALEASLEAITRAVAGCDQSELAAAKARGVMIGYHARWAQSGWRPLLVQPAFHLPIVNPPTGCRSRTFTQAGRCDAVVARDRREFLLESKTVGEDIDHRDAPFWRRLAVDTQADTYAQARRQQGRPVAGILYDVIRRPQVKPRLVPKGSPARSDEQNAGTRLELQRRKAYFGWPVQRQQREEFFRGDGRETPALYSARLAADTIRRPGWYFQRRLVPRSEEQLARHRHDLWQTAVEIRLARGAGRHYANSDACMAYGRPCPYLPICCGRDAPDSDRWKPAVCVHPELRDELGDVDPRSVLTHSRIQCFKLCRRRHYFRYELGIVPVEQTLGETLRFARVIRQALAAWWRNLNSTA
jgi:hypothetical protein